MKDFVKMTLAVICGLVIMSVLLFILGFGFLGAIMASGSSTPALPKSGVLTIDMSRTVICEQSRSANPLNSLKGGSNAAEIGIWDAVQAINAAATDPVVQYIYLKTDGSATAGYAAEELRAALGNFRRNSGKAVISYMESPTTGSYYLASVADKIYMTSYLGSSAMVSGVGTQMIFLGDLLKRLGVNVQLIRHGKYKSAGEMYTRSGASAENREQYQRLVDSMWESIAGEITGSRDISIDELNSCIENLELNLPQDFLDHRLVDGLVDKEGLEERLATLAVKDDFKDVKIIQFSDYVAARVLPGKAKKKIAVIYADGEIVDGNGKSEVAGDRFASLIAKVRADSTVKAVVLRVNSPGGSVLASEKIKHELDRLKDVKPLVASYGGYAASGGYWISNNCDKIFSDRMTLTGSIGVFGMIPDFSGTTKDILHVGVENVTSHKHGDMFSLTRPFDQAEYSYMQHSIETIYDKFTSIVAEGRSMPKETVDAIGQGRVWTGCDALTINLVDNIGTLEDAIYYAAAAAGDPDISVWNVQGYPQPMSQVESILSMFGDDSSYESKLLGKLKDWDEPYILARMDTEIKIK